MFIFTIIHEQFQTSAHEKKLHFQNELQYKKNKPCN